MVTFAGRQVMLPGAKGFYLNDHLNLTPPLYLSGVAGLRRAYASNRLEKAAERWPGAAGKRRGEIAAPSDWVALRADGKMEPAKEPTE